MEQWIQAKREDCDGNAATFLEIALIVTLSALTSLWYDAREAPTSWYFARSNIIVSQQTPKYLWYSKNIPEKLNWEEILVKDVDCNNSGAS